MTGRKECLIMSPVESDPAVRELATVDDRGHRRRDSVREVAGGDVRARARQATSALFGVRLLGREHAGMSTGGLEAKQSIGEEVLQHMAALRRYAILLLGSVNDADDVVQETLMRILNQGKPVAEIRDLRSYLFATLHNIYIDDTRRQRRMASQVPIENVLSTLSSPATQHKRLELRDLAHALGRLPIEQREVVLLVGIEGMSYADAAKTLDVPVGTIMSRLSRGREALRHLTARGATPKLRVVK